MDQNVLQQLQADYQLASSSKDSEVRQSARLRFYNSVWTHWPAMFDAMKINTIVEG